MEYQVAERFKSIQGEGVYAGTPMAFVRFVGCSVGKKICQHCDTTFERTLPWQGGGVLTVAEILTWAKPMHHLCLTGGEPFDQDLFPIISSIGGMGMKIHIETSGTKLIPPIFPQTGVWLCVSPKPGFLEETVRDASEIKVIVPGLGNGEGWPTLQDALRWTSYGIPVFLQPRNARDSIDQGNLRLCQELVLQHPQLHLSVQLHKLLEVR